MLGETISHYRIVGKLGAGGMGVVYEGVDTRLDRKVAIKLLSDHRVVDGIAKKRFIAEAKAASALDHPNICSVYDIDETADGRMFMVMAYYEGDSLEHYVDERRLPISEAVALVMQMADGLGRAHSQGIVHRDIKPSNAIVTNDGLVKILDFGLAKMEGSDSLTRSGSSVGTPAYMSPEQIQAETFDHRTDIWSLGVLLYALIAGEVPFKGDHHSALFYSILNTDPAPMSSKRGDVPEALEAVVAKCLSKDPAGRYESCADLIADLRKIARRLDGESLSEMSSLLIERAESVSSAAKPRGTVSSGPGAKRSQAVGLRMVLVGLLIAASGFGGWKLIQKITQRPPLRVAVMPVNVVSTDTVDDRVASNAKVSFLRGLLALKGIAPVEVTRGSDGKAEPSEIAELFAADEVVQMRVTEGEAEWSIETSRYLPDGSTVQAVRFAVPKAEPLLMASAIQSQMTNLYPNMPASDETTALDVRTGDYETYLRMREMMERGLAENNARGVLDTLAAVSKTSPRFADAHILEASVARYLYKMTGDGEMLKRGYAAVENTKRLLPNEPRALGHEFDLAMRAGDVARAERVVRDLQKQAPGNVEVLLKEARLAEVRGDTERAIRLTKDVVARRFSRDYVFRLADIEYRVGKFQDARKHLGQLLDAFPGDPYARSKLAEIELMYGDAAVAEKLYAEMVLERPRISSLVNLGIAQELQGKYKEAAVNLERALELAPGDAVTMLNLADCENLAGRTARADSLYQRVIELIDGHAAADGWDFQLMKAQCLAHLDDHTAAVSLVQQALRKESDDSEALYMASLVYAIVGDRNSALANASEAMVKGVQAVWFELPWFDAIRDDPIFSELHSDQTPTNP